MEIGPTTKMVVLNNLRNILPSCSVKKMLHMSFLESLEIKSVFLLPPHQGRNSLLEIKGMSLNIKMDQLP